MVGAFFRELLIAVPGVSDRLLSQRLRRLEAEGLVERCVHEGPPARVSYCLTEAGIWRSIRRFASFTTGLSSGARKPAQI